MNDKSPKLIANILQEKFACPRVTYSAKGTGFSACYVFDTDQGKYFVKVNQEKGEKFYLKMFEAEEKGLNTLIASKTIRAPKPFLVGREEGYSFLIMEYIPLSEHTPVSQRQLGHQLAKMHAMPAGKRFGFESDNTIGTTLQINSWNSHWIDFFVKHRLQFQLKLLEEKRGDTEIRKKGEIFIEKYVKFFDKIPIIPSLLHGDLWGGNTGRDASGNPTVFDPAVYYGHYEAEFGILLLFGGFTEEFHSAYQEIRPREAGFSERQLGYQLYHLLNHYAIFGSSYRSSCMSILRSV